MKDDDDGWTDFDGRDDVQEREMRSEQDVIVR